MTDASEPGTPAGWGNPAGQPAPWPPPEPQPGYQPPPGQPMPPGQPGQPGYGDPGYGVPGQPGYGAPSYGAPGQPGYSAPGYGAPGQPGYGMPPAPGYGAPMGTKPPDYLVWGIVASVCGMFFCWFGLGTGIATIIYANRVRDKWAAGDQQGALEASRAARGWAIAATVLCALGLVILVVLVVAGLYGSTTTTP